MRPVLCRAKRIITLLAMLTAIISSQSALQKWWTIWSPKAYCIPSRLQIPSHPILQIFKEQTCSHGTVMQSWGQMPKDSASLSLSFLSFQNHCKTTSLQQSGSKSALANSSISIDSNLSPYRYKTMAHKWPDYQPTASFLKNHPDWWKCIPLFSTYPSAIIQLFLYLCQALLPVTRSFVHLDHFERNPKTRCCQMAGGPEL